MFKKILSTALHNGLSLITGVKCRLCQENIRLTSTADGALAFMPRSICRHCLEQLCLVNYAGEIHFQDTSNIRCALDLPLPYISLSAYEREMITLVHAIKYSDDIASALDLSYMLFALLEKSLIKEGVTYYVVPIPLHRDKEKERGYNQAEIISANICRLAAIHKNLGLSLIHAPQLLKRCKHTRVQRSLDKAARLENVKDAFVVDAAQRNKVKGRDIIIIDDVLTSGATIYSAAASLREAAAGSITAATLARARWRIYN